jgi:hypothetical protein
MAPVETVDIAWLLVSAVLVLFMQAGFTALESGLVRSKNSANAGRLTRRGVAPRDGTRPRMASHDGAGGWGSRPSERAS